VRNSYFENQKPTPIRKRSQLNGIIILFSFFIILA